MVFENETHLLMSGLSEPWAPEQRWPPQCCVPAFVYAALGKQGNQPSDPAELARAIGVRISSGDANPFGLRVAGSAESVGISAREAALTIPDALRKLNPGLAFRHVRLKEISLELYEDVIVEALGRKLTVGIGVDCSRLYHTSTVRHLHVFRVINLSDGKVLLCDDSHEVCPSEFLLPWPQVEQASIAAGDGLWLVGRPGALSLPYTLPI